MKILHVCLAAFYIDDYSYQENILPKFHKLQGHDVEIVASRETYIENKKLGLTDAREYINENGIKVTRVNYSSFLPLKLAAKIRKYFGVNNILNNFTPDIIFLHDTQFASVREIARYCKRNKNVQVFADCHTDYVNSGKNWISKNILHKIIYRYYTHVIEPYVIKFYGTLPVRNLFLRDVYKVPASKIELLELGADDSLYNLNEKSQKRTLFFQEHGLDQDDFIIITGGKIDERKKIHLLLDTFVSLEMKGVKLVIFGEPNDDMILPLERFKKHKNIIFLGWLKNFEIYDVLLSSDLAVFPGTHSVLWEQSVGVGLPCIFKKWKGIQHVDLGDNCLFLENDSSEELISKLKMLIPKNEVFNKLKFNAEKKGPNHFAYSKIAARAIKK